MGGMRSWSGCGPKFRFEANLLVLLARWSTHTTFTNGKANMMTKNHCSKLAGLVAASLSTCFAGSCATGFRDAALTGVFDFTSATVSDTLGSLISVSDLLDGAGTEE